MELEITEKEARCYSAYGCFAFFSRDDNGILSIVGQVTPVLAGQRLGMATVVGVEEIAMRGGEGRIIHGHLYICVSELKQETPEAEGCLTMILPSSRAECFQRYGYVTLPFDSDDSLPVGGAVQFKYAMSDLEPATIIAVQEFQPTWSYLYIVARKNH